MKHDKGKPDYNFLIKTIKSFSKVTVYKPRFLPLHVITKVITFALMQQIYQIKISKIGNSRGIRLPKELVLSLGTSDVILEKTSEGILIKPSPIVPPLSEWAEIFAKADTSSEPEFEDWDITLNDGQDEEEL